MVAVSLRRPDALSLPAPAALGSGTLTPVKTSPPERQHVNFGSSAANVATSKDLPRQAPMLGALSPAPIGRYAAE